MRALAITMLLLGVAAPMRAEESPPPSRLETFLSQPGISGDWRGGRAWLDARGIDLSATYVTDILGNPTGGINHKVRYDHDIFVGAKLDLEKLAGLAGARFVVSMSSRAGNSLSDEDIGNVFNVSEVCCEFETRLVTLAWEQTMLEHRLSWRLGHLCTGDDFATSPLYALFVTSGINANPGALAFNVPFFEYPDATLGAMIEAQVVPDVSLKVGVYNGNADGLNRAGANFSTDFGGGVLNLAELEYEAELPIAGADPGLPGHYSVGGYYNTGRFRRFDAPADSDLPRDVEHGTGGFYFLVDQMLYREPDTEADGLTPFVALVFAPSQEISEFPFFFNAGLVYEGLLPDRPDDTAVFGMLYGAFSSDLRAAQAGSPSGQQDFEMVLEWSYIVQVGQWLQLQPDVQYVIKPGGTGKIPDALVLGAQITIGF